MEPFVLYSYFRSSASYRVRIALNLKGIAYEYRPIHLVKDGGEQNKSAYRDLNPSGEVPLLIHGSHKIAQSMAILEYLEEIHDGPRLFPQEPYSKALVRQACEIVNSGIQPLGNLKVQQHLEAEYSFTPEQKIEWTVQWMKRGLRSLEEFLVPRAGTYSFGGAVTAADAFVVPQIYNAHRFKVDMSPYPALSGIYESCLRLEAFQKASPENQPDTPPELRGSR